MKNSPSKLALMVGISLALAFTFSCSSGGGGDSGGGDSNNQSCRPGSLDGVWEFEDDPDFQITISGSTGKISAFPPSDEWKVGDQVWRNLTSTGNLTWSGQENWSKQDTEWVNARLTISGSGGRKLTIFYPDSDYPDDGITFSRKCNNQSSSSRSSSSHDPHEACKNIVFNASTNFCYDGIVYDKCNGMGYNPSTHICQGTAAYPAVCGARNEAYNPLEKGCCDDRTFNLSNQRCQDDVVEEKCGEIWYDISNPNLSCSERYLEAKCGSEWYKYDIFDSDFRCNNNVLEEKCGSVWYNVSNSTQYCSNGTTLKNYGSVTYEGKTYKTVVIGEQTWMAENLNYDYEGSRCYNDDPTNCDKYGRLYDWEMAMDVCPPSWHLPSNDEWWTIEHFVFSFPRNKLRASSGWGNDNGKNTFGFSAMPGGYYGSSYGSSDGGFRNVGSGGFWWIACRDDSNYAEYRFIGISDLYGSGERAKEEIALYSVRCIQDN